MIEFIPQKTTYLINYPDEINHPNLTNSQELPKDMGSHVAGYLEIFLVAAEKKKIHAKRLYCL